MCGIMGFYCFGIEKPKKENITDMFSLLETRGRDASGFAFIREGELMVHKAAIRSSEMTATTTWKTLELSDNLIAHTRMKTQGSERNNANNHPIFNKQGLCLVHNGMIHNDKEIFGKNRRDAEVDSEAILAVLSSKVKGDRIRQVFERLEGSFAFALIDKHQPEQLVLVKKDNPIELYLDTERDILYFCSEQNIMREALKIKSRTQRGFNLGEGEYHHYTMENNHCLIINKEGVETYKRYSPKREVFRTLDYHGSHSSRFKDGLIVECPWCCAPTVFYEGRTHNQCENCGLDLNEEDLYV